MLRALGLLLLVSASSAFAQPPESFAVIEERQTNVPAYFFHVLPGEATIQVYIWGAVGTPGAYMVAAGTDLERLLSLAGGPQVDLEQAEYIDSMFIRLYREQGGRREMIYEATRQDMIANPAAYPTLQTGDVIEVATYRRRRATFRDYLSIAGSVAAIVLTVERLSSALSSD